jgi:hypothetical protein
MVIHQSLASRVILAVFALIAWADIGYGLAIALWRRSPAAFPIFLMLAWFVFYLSRSYRLSAEMGPDRLVVRNRFRTYEIHREDIVDFRVGSSGYDPIRRAIQVVRRGEHSVELAVTRRFDLRERGRLQLDQWLGQLRSWSAHQSTSEPTPG